MHGKKNNSVVFLRDCSPTDPHADLLHKTPEERVNLFHTRRLMRVAFYADLGRRPPTVACHMASYVRAVRTHWKLKYNNSARQLLAEIEGFPSWEVMMNTAAQECDCITIEEAA